MPTYGYECTACTDQFEIFQSIKDAALTTCEKCGGTLRKRIYPVGIAFKGPGFYVNDYSSSKKAAATSGSTSTEKPADSAASTAPEAKSSEPAASTTPSTTAPAPAAA